MAFAGEYKCSVCGNHTEAKLLTAKKVMFQSLGVKPTTIKSRIESWLCPRCIIEDPAWKMEAYSSPGMIPAPKQPRILSDEEIRLKAIRDSQAEYDAAMASAED